MDPAVLFVSQKAPRKYAYYAAQHFWKLGKPLYYTLRWPADCNRLASGLPITRAPAVFYRPQCLRS